MQYTYEQLLAKSSFSNIVSDDQVKEVYRHRNIVTDERGFTNREQVDEFIKLAIAKAKHQ